MIKGFKKNKIYVSYTFYDANQQLISTKKVQITKNTNEIVTDKAIKEGYVKVLVIGNSKSFYFKNIIINSKNPAEDYSGGVASTMALTTGADCNGGGDGDGGYVDETGPCEIKYNSDLKKCNDRYNSCKEDCRSAYGPLNPLRYTCYIGCWDITATCKENAYIIYEGCKRN